MESSVGRDYANWLPKHCLSTEVSIAFHYSRDLPKLEMPESYMHKGMIQNCYNGSTRNFSALAEDGVSVRYTSCRAH